MTSTHIASSRSWPARQRFSVIAGTAEPAHGDLARSGVDTRRTSFTDRETIFDSALYRYQRPPPK
jgi:hypothetical protein